MEEILIRLKEMLKIILAALVVSFVAFCIVSSALSLFSRWRISMSAVDNPDRFIKLPYAQADILLDTETGVQYLLKGSDMSVLVDADGVPVLYEGGTENE